MAEKVHPLAQTMGTAMQLLFQDKIAAIQTPKAAGLPAMPPVPPPNAGGGDNNPATSAIKAEQAKAQDVPTPSSVLNSKNASSLLFPSASTVANNTSAASLLKIKT
jgi:hypothetical protein